MGGGQGIWRMLGALNLSDEQRSKLDDIADEKRRSHWELMGKRMDHSTQLRRLYAAERPDAKAIGAVYGKMFDFKRQMIESTIEANNQAKDLLTDEQRKQLQLMGSPRMPPRMR